MKPMSQVIRCGNCGQVIKRQGARCPDCHYQFDPDRIEDIIYSVILDDFGPNVSETTSVLMRGAGKTMRDVYFLQQHLPIRILTSRDYKEVRELVDSLEEAGARAEIRIEEAVAGIESEEKPEIPEAPFVQIPKKRRVMWLIPLIALIPVLAIHLQDLIAEIPSILDSVLDRYIQKELASFHQVTVIAAARDIGKGSVISLEDLKPVLIPRDTAPPDAIAPLNVGVLIGRTAEQTIHENQIILSESMTDYE